MTPFRFNPLALAEFENAVASYEHEQPGLGDRFRSAVFETLHLTAAFPHIWREVRPGVRRALTRRFPYCLYYRINGDFIAVQAVLHARGDPAYHASRLDEE